MSDLNQLVAKVGGQKNAAILAGVVGAGGIWIIGRRKAAKSQTSPVNVMAQGYSDTADDPTAIYTGYDQLQQEIDNLRTQPGATNPNPVPTPTSPGSPPPVAPVPAPMSVPDYGANIPGQYQYLQPAPVLRAAEGEGGNRLPGQGGGFLAGPSRDGGGGGGGIRTPSR